MVHFACVVSASTHFWVLHIFTKYSLRHQKQFHRTVTKRNMELLPLSTYSGPEPGSPEQINAIITELRHLYPDAKCTLDFSNPLELLVATQLAAQCTDERVNIVTKELFRKYRTVEDYANVSQEELEQDIKSTGFYRNKAKNIRAACQLIISKYG